MGRRRSASGSEAALWPGVSPAGVPVLPVLPVLAVLAVLVGLTVLVGLACGAARLGGSGMDW